jgi:hypothetical protein
MNIRYEADALSTAALIKTTTTFQAVAHDVVGNPGCACILYITYLNVLAIAPEPSYHTTVLAGIKIFFGGFKYI